MKKTLAAIMILAAGMAVAASTFTGRIRIQPDWTHTKTSGGSTLKETFDALITWSHTTGTNANQMATVVSRTGTLTNSASITYDLTDIDNSFGDNVHFAEVRFMAITCTNGMIQVGAAAANAFDTWLGDSSDAVKIREDGIALFIAPDLTGYAVSANGNLKILNTTTNTVGYEIYIGGSE